MCDTELQGGAVVYEKCLGPDIIGAVTVTGVKYARSGPAKVRARCGEAARLQCGSSGRPFFLCFSVCLFGGFGFGGWAWWVPGVRARACRL